MKLFARLRRRDDSGSIPMALLLTLVGASLAALLLPMVVSQVSATRLDTRRVNALNAAHAGLQAALGQIRDVPDRTACKPVINLLGVVTVGGCSLIGVGLLGIGINLVVFTKSNGLPCSPISGSVGTGSSATYTVTMKYLPDDPRRHDDNWIQQNDWCQTKSNNVSVGYALVRSQGTDQGRTRTLEATYMFETPHRNSTSGGLIDINVLNSARCIAAPSNPPKAGDALRVVTCSAGNAAQTFQYNEDLTIRLDGSPGMCLTSSGQQGGNVTFQPCTSPPSPSQQWFLNDNGAFQGVTSGLAPAVGLCLNVLPGASLITLDVLACDGTTLNWHAPPDGRPFRDIRER
ncbi:ricin-type beta-trefoil lectin domain protein [Planosporangium flavigriseum]|uniref:Ricin B lectin domain-containing protein n=1 Tax=Planosporangium flavigriseum TaxID=373681 RepID=A0A8J3LZ42_9ACTN|nr:RICIN domain-containing protein [Planosporangium flavigriseum]NJC67216.1 ricin-type beta-trefoil lectin domain protein [Planosporangium flavigriseum]GIG76146.1 hypothetical protein Pfl04_45500 [Planosporangium flavigriseum]